MNRSPLLFLLACLALAPLRAADEPRLTALRAADDERVAAMRAGDRPRLTAIFSDELRYAHSSGSVDDKASFIEALTTGRTKYTVIDYEQREFTFPAPAIALMTGRVHVQATSAAGALDTVLSYLAVWREEKGAWRILAWQSCRPPPPAPAAK